MFQVAAPIWNGIAEEGLHSPQGKRLFHLSQDQLTTALTLQEEWLVLLGYDPRAIRGLITVWPLLLEREAISRYLAKHPQYRHALPEVKSIQEAVILADLEYRLTTAQQKELADLLLMLESGTQPPAKAQQDLKSNTANELPKDPPLELLAEGFKIYLTGGKTALRKLMLTHPLPEDIKEGIDDIVRSFSDYLYVVLALEEERAQAAQAQDAEEEALQDPNKKTPKPPTPQQQPPVDRNFLHLVHQAERQSEARRQQSIDKLLDEDLKGDALCSNEAMLAKQDGGLFGG